MTSSNSSRTPPSPCPLDVNNVAYTAINVSSSSWQNTLIGKIHWNYFQGLNLVLNYVIKIFKDHTTVTTYMKTIKRRCQSEKRT